MNTTIWALHGAVGMAADWRVLARALAQAGVAFRAVDLWRFLDCCPMSLPACGAAINQEARAVPGRRVLLGYSLGGRLALHALLDDPGLWDAAVIVSAHPGLASEEERVARRAADAAWSAAALKDDWGGFLTAWEGQEIFRAAAELPGDRRLLLARRAAVARSFIDWSLGAQQELTPELGRIGCPLVWVAGGRDGKFLAAGRRAVAALGRAELVEVAGCGHRVPWECPGEFERLVMAAALGADTP
jgi:2-succinyl-6-hydroxy-2,4-cyclohexadiene-1-carboxylate synthase